MALAQAKARCWELPWGLLTGKVAQARAGAGFPWLPNNHGYHWRGCGRSKSGESGLSKKLLPKAKSDYNYELTNEKVD